MKSKKIMKYGSLIIEKKEFVHLKRILNISSYVEDFKTQKSLQRFNEELQQSKILDECDMPEDIVRFNSTITLVTENGWEKTLQIVLPTEKDLKQNKISILTTMGSALFGYSQDDTIIWDFPAGPQQLKIVKVTQAKNQLKVGTPI